MCGLIVSLHLFFFFEGRWWWLVGIISSKKKKKMSWNMYFKDECIINICLTRNTDR